MVLTIQGRVQVLDQSEALGCQFCRSSRQFLIGPKPPVSPELSGNIH
jgi:hypothetical protein